MAGAHRKRVIMIDGSVLANQSNNILVFLWLSAKNLEDLIMVGIDKNSIDVRGALEDTLIAN
jgi:hypothetical protein